MSDHPSEPTGHLDPDVPGEPPAVGEPAAPAASDHRPRRGRRRAVGGTGTPGDEPRAPRAVEDTDAAWGERPDDGDDERLLREVPPHW